MPLIGAVGSRSVLRDALRRLNEIRVACGKGEGPGNQQFVPTGDPFADRLQIFKGHSIEVKEAIKDRDATAEQRTAEDQTEYIRSDARVLGLLAKMKLDVDALGRYVAEAHGKLIEAEKAKRSPEKIQAKRNVHHERLRATQEAESVLANCNALAATSAKSIATSRLTGKKQQLLEQANVQRKSRVHAAMETLRRANAQHVDPGRAQTFQELEALTRNDPYGANDTEIPRLENSEYRTQYMQIQDQKQQIDAGLDRLSAAIARIRQQMVTIGDELDTQNKMLEETRANVVQRTQDVKQLRKQVEAVLKKQAPMNMCVNVFCFILLLGLIGYFLFRFKVVG